MFVKVCEGRRPFCCGHYERRVAGFMFVRAWKWKGNFLGLHTMGAGFMLGCIWKRRWPFLRGEGGGGFIF